METFIYTFEAFRTDITQRVRLLNAGLSDPEATWPGVLFLDIPNGLGAEAFEIAGISDEDKRELAERTLPDRIRAGAARRFCWAMPAWLRGDRPQECLILVFGERDRCEVVLAFVVRGAGCGPRLGRWQQAPFGPSLREISGLFVDPLRHALDEAATNWPRPPLSRGQRRRLGD
jgi:hypothetical protein